jgi:uncharacterized protein DUF87
VTDHVHAGFEHYRDMREQVERDIRPSAYSLDGRSFTFTAPVSLAVQPGGYVALETLGGRVLGQIVDCSLQLLDGPEMEAPDDAGRRARTTLRYHALSGSGWTLQPAQPFHDVLLGLAEQAELAAWREATAPRGARLTVGELMYAPGLPAEVDAIGFDRHTFLCGQSGSGKSYSLGVILEQLLLETDLRIVVLDPNSDFVRLPEVRDGIDAAVASRWTSRTAAMRVRAADGSDDRLQLRFADLDAPTQAAVMGLDPLADREEYGALLTLLERDRSGEQLDELLGSLATGNDVERALGLRIRNLGLMEWSAWARAQGVDGLMHELDRDDWRLLVVDLGSLVVEAERAMVAEAVLARLWQQRADRRPVLCVVDEAHNVCPQHPADPLTALATEHAVRIAGEGRKFGLHLLVSTQRPGKVHENVLSQCDNLILMKMNSASDIARLVELFSYAPPSLIERSTALTQGESLVAGKIAGAPVFVRFGARVAQEGGGDVGADWATARAD